MTGQPLPMITVVTPSYNQGQFIEETLVSVVTQQYPALEYIVVDGGSTDGSVDTIKRYADQLAWWVSEPDRGQSHAINKGFAKATGEILTWLNSDDVLCPGALHRVAAFFQAHPWAGAVVGDQPVIDATGRELDVKKSVPINYWLALHSMCGVPQPATFFTRRALECAGGLVDESLSYQMDAMLFLRMLKGGVRFGTIRHPIARFRLHGDSKTVSEYDRRVGAANRVIQERLSGSPQDSELARLRWRAARFVARGVLYAERLALRGSVVPFRGTRARRAAAHAPDMVSASSESEGFQTDKSRVE